MSCAKLRWNGLEGHGQNIESVRLVEMRKWASAGARDLLVSGELVHKEHELHNNQVARTLERRYTEIKAKAPWLRNDAAAPIQQFNLKHSQDESSRRGVTVVPPKPFFNGMNCIERPHWSVVNSGMANGEDQTLSLSMWLSPSSSLRLKRGDIGLSDAARLKSSLSLQAAAGQGELSVSPGGGTRNASDGDWTWL